MHDDPLTECEECGAPVERVFTPVAVHFKGSGFYTTDYARKGTKTADSERRRLELVGLVEELRSKSRLEEVRLGLEASLGSKTSKASSKD